MVDDTWWLQALVRFFSRFSQASPDIVALQLCHFGLILCLDYWCFVTMEGNWRRWICVVLKSMVPNMCAAVQFNLNSSIAPKLQHTLCYQNSHSSILVSNTGLFFWANFHQLPTSCKGVLWKKCTKVTRFMTGFLKLSTSTLYCSQIGLIPLVDDNSWNFLLPLNCSQILLIPLWDDHQCVYIKNLKKKSHGAYII